MEKLEPIEGPGNRILHNPEPESVQQILEANKDKEMAVLMIKPDGLKRTLDGTPVKDIIENTLKAEEITILCTSNRQISARSVYRIYRDVLKPNKEADNKYGKQWKRDVMNHISEEPIFAYLLSGEAVEQRTKEIKNHLRDKLCDPSVEGQIVKNIAHVADEEDFDVTVKTLFF